MRFQPGQVVYLKSSKASGGLPATVLFGHAAVEAVEADIGTKPGKPESYDLIMQDGIQLVTFTAPVYALCDEHGVGVTL